MNECPECGSNRIIKDIHIKEQGENYADLTLRAVYFENPDAWIFKKGIHSDIRAEVCADCGLLRTYAADPERLWSAYLAKNSDVE
jgi:hypothetical protein